MKLQVNVLGAYKDRAASRINEHYCNIARQNAHEFSLATLDIIRGKRTDHPLDEYEGARAALLARIKAATTKDEIDAALATLGL